MNSPQPIPGLLTPSELSKKRPGLAEPIPLDKRVKRAEEPKPTPQAPKSDAERFAELEGELFGPEPPTEPRASELSKQMFEHLGKEPAENLLRRGARRPVALGVAPPRRRQSTPV